MDMDTVTLHGFDHAPAAFIGDPLTLTENAHSSALVTFEDLVDSGVMSPMSTAEMGEIILGPSIGNGAELETGGAPVGGRSEATAATKLQKVYRSYRTRRRLADTAVLAEELWWQALDFARLNHSTISFFDYSKPESAISRWNRISIIASKVGQGLSKDSKALKLAFQHWIEAIDPRHRYGHNLHFYYEKWCDSDAGQPFFYWLDLGDGKNVELKECPRSLLRQQCIKYLGPAIWAYSGHYKPSNENLNQFLSYLKENGIDLTEVVIRSASSEDYEETKKPEGEGEADDVVDAFSISKPPPLQIPPRSFIVPSEQPTETSINSETENGKVNEIKAYKRTLSGGLQSPKTDVSEKALQERIKSKMKSSSYQLGHQVSFKWSTGAGPRIGCVADYPVELRLQALELTNLSPTWSRTPKKCS
ncbi:IQ domain-containing protein IQM3 isoform X2 [Dendrobium catenatum]|uniref:IQ domain-containing protein IQM3 isoform X2 n=1 Tax=Dendrobium catenatum TaxID=906689 RepID=UPI0009F4E725|nr:IQ domain-containing protein IQM3 isoform X2 [Dendrobium catenatum]